MPNANTALKVAVDHEIITPLEILTHQMNAETLIRDMVAALENCFDCKQAVTWEAEQEADIMIRRAKKFLGV